MNDAAASGNQLVKSTPETSDVYWAASGPDEIASKIYGKVQRYFQALPSLTIYRTWVKAYNSAYPLIDQDIMRGGSQGQNTVVRVNVVSAYLRLVTALLLGVMPDPVPRPINTDYKSLQQATLVQRFFDYFLDASGIRVSIAGAERLAGMYGMGWLLCHFNKRLGPWKAKPKPPPAPPVAGVEVPEPDVDPLDPLAEIVTETWTNPETGVEYVVPIRVGAVETRIFGVFDMVYELGRKDQDHPWYIYPTRYDRWDLAAAFPEQREEILAYTEPLMFPNETSNAVSTLEIERNQPYVKDPDQVTSWTLVHTPNYALPAGAKCEILGPNIVLEPRHGLPTKELPVVMFQQGNIDRTCLAESTFHHVLALGDVVNDVFSSIVTNNIAFSKQMLDIPRTADYDITDVTDGLAVIDRVEGEENRPTAIQLTASSPESYKLAGEVLPDFIAQLMGIKKSMLGSPPASWPAQMNRDVWAQALQYQSEAHFDLITKSRKVFNLLLEVLKSSDVTILAEVAGTSQMTALKEFTKKDFELIGSIDIKLRDPADRDYESRQTKAEKMGQLGLLDKDQYLEVSETGSTEAGTDGELDVERLIIAENQALGLGLSNPPVLDGQPHMRHIRRHLEQQASCDLATPAGQQASALIDEHNAMHIMSRRKILLLTPELAEASGEPPPAPPPAGPGGAPASGGAGASSGAGGGAKPAPTPSSTPPKPGSTPTGKPTSHPAPATTGKTT